MTEEQKKQYAESLKSADTEEWIDLVFYRPIGFRWALFFQKLGVTPNAVTIVSIFLGVAAGVMFYFQSLSLKTYPRAPFMISDLRFGGTEMLLNSYATI